jgi:hypothetical protein
MRLSSKIGNLPTPDTDMLQIMINNSLYRGIMNLGDFLKIEFFTKTPIPPP